MKWLLFVIFFNCPCLLLSQQQVTGVVLEAGTGTPIAGASVFLSNTSVGTVTNSQGVFEINVPAGRFDLVVSSIGYETYTQIITGATTRLSVALHPKAKELENVVVAPFEPDGWAKWGLFFIENFIGTSAQAKACVLKNTTAIKFRHSKKAGELTAVAFEPLLIENKALGYRVRYQLETFSYNFNTGYLLFQGYPFFEPMAGGAVRQRHWAAKRKDAYEGSMLHFMRSVYRNNIAESGFEMHALQKIPNIEKKRIQVIYKTKDIAQINASKDSAAYYEKLLRQPDHFDVMAKTLLTGDSIAYAIDAVTAGLDFNNYLVVNYKGKLAAPEYRQHDPKAGTAISSQLFLLNGRPVAIQANGSYYDPGDLLSIGYWSWWEKIATMLPFDYKPD